MTTLREAREELADLNPPAEAREAHNELLEAIAQAEDAWERVADAVPDTLTAEDIVYARYINTPEVKAAVERLAAACQALQEIADQNGIDVDIGAGDCFD